MPRYDGSLEGHGEREGDRKREKKPNVEVVTEGSCDVISGDFGFDYKAKRNYRYITVFNL